MRQFAWVAFFWASLPIVGPVAAGAAPNPGAVSPTTDRPAAECAKVACRGSQSRVTIHTQDGREVSFSVANAPYVLDGKTILIFPGETLVFQLSGEGAEQTPTFVRVEEPPAAVAPLSKEAAGKNFPASDPNELALRQTMAELKANGTAKDRLKDEPAGTVIVQYEQMNGGPGMSLRIEHNLPRRLTVNATISVFRGSEFQSQHSSVCTILPNLSDNEYWPYPLGAIFLSDLTQAVQEGNSVTCQ
jgi:hypothetical protein